EILPFRPPPIDRLLCLADGQTWIFATELNKHIKLGPAPYYWEYCQRLRSWDRIGFAPYASKEERNASQLDWKRPTQKRRWAIKARAKLKGEHATLFWSDDNLSNYEIWSESVYSRALYESYFRPHRVPWFTATHTVRDKNQKTVGRIQHSPYLIGESDYG